jgi:DNA-binding LytR/AlgR family response regulator
MKDEYLFITSKKKLHKINLQAINLIEAMDDYVKINLRDSKSVVTRMTMKLMMEQLDKRQFIRVHRSFIVPVKDIEAVGANAIVVNGKEISVGKKYAAGIMMVFRQSR